MQASSTFSSPMVFLRTGKPSQGRYALPLISWATSDMVPQSWHPGVEDVRFSVETCGALHSSLRRALLSFECGLVVRTTETICCIERIDERWHVFIAGNAVPASLCEQQSRSDPAQPVIAALPTFYLLEDMLDHREPALDAIGAGEGLAQFRR